MPDRAALNLAVITAAEEWRHAPNVIARVVKADALAIAVDDYERALNELADLGVSAVTKTQ